MPANASSKGIGFNIIPVASGQQQDWHIFTAKLAQLLCELEAGGIWKLKVKQDSMARVTFGDMTAGNFQSTLPIQRPIGTHTKR